MAEPKVLTKRGFSQAVRREADALAALERYERKSAFWLRKVLTTREKLRRIRRRIEDSEVAVANGATIPPEEG